MELTRFGENFEGYISGVFTPLFFAFYILRYIHQLQDSSYPSGLMGVVLVCAGLW